MSRLLRLVPILRGIAGLSLLTGLVIYTGGIDVLLLLSQMEFFWMSGVTICVVTATLLGAINVRLLLQKHHPIRIVHFLPAYWLAWAVGLVIPGQVGDLASLSLWLRSRGVSWHVSIGPTLLDKLISLLVVTVVGIWGMSLVSALRPFLLTAIPWVTFILSAVVICAWFLRRSLLAFLSHRNNLIARTLRIILTTVDSQPQIILINLGLTTIKVGLLGMAYWYMFAALGQVQLSLLPVVGLAAASSLVAYIPVSFNGLGTVELVGLILFATLGLDDTVVLSAYLGLRLTVLILAWLPAVVWLTFRTKVTDKTLSKG